MKIEYRIKTIYKDKVSKWYFVEKKISHKNIILNFLYGHDWNVINREGSFINNEMKFDFAFFSNNIEDCQDFIDFISIAINP